MSNKCFFLLYSTSHIVEIVIYLIDLFNLIINKMLFWKIMMIYYYSFEWQEKFFIFLSSDDHMPK